MQRFYGDLASFWPLISPVEEYEAEAAEYARLLLDAHPTAKTVLELGAGGGNNAYFLKRRFALVLSDLSDAMLENSRRINPTCEHVVGDMRTLRLARKFDAVFVHDAVDYMTSECELAEVFATARAHLDVGGVLLVAPDATREGFLPSTDCGGSDGDDGRSIRYLEWSYDADPNDGVATTEYAFVIREATGDVRYAAETHVAGLFAEATWLRLLGEAGFEAAAVREVTDEERTPRTFFVGRLRA